MRILNCKNLVGSAWPKSALNIMRGSPFGNPFHLGVHGDRELVVHHHMVWLRWKISVDPSYRAMVKALKDYDLVCCCAPEKCHGDNLKLVCEELNKLSGE